MFTSLSDPDKCVDSARLSKLSKKIDKALLLMSRSTKKGGNPFLFAFLASKPHYLAKDIPGFHLPEFLTAATDGKVFYWNPDFLDRLASEDVVTVMNHESMHVVLRHVERSIGKHPQVWNIAIDFVVNSIIEHDHKLLKRAGSPWRVGVFGPNITLERFLRFLEGKAKLPLAKKDSGSGVFTDRTLYKTSVNDIYDEILKRWEDSSDQTKKELKEQFGGNDTLDSHIPSDSAEEEIQEQIMMASKMAEKMEPGSTPGYVQSMIKKLTPPTFDFIEVIKMCLFNRQHNEGIKNNWKRPKRRWLSSGQYMPSVYSFKPKWLCLLDTSGSMSDEDIRYGVSQLQSLGEDTDGMLVPCDSKVHWDLATEIKSASDLESTPIKGGGGTLLDEFFEEFPERLGTDFDVVIVITDGFMRPPPQILQPECQVVWAITNGSASFAPAFGQKVTLKQSN